MSPYREVDHTADWALHVWAPTLEELYVDAARGMYALAGTSGSDAPSETFVRRLIDVRADDAESLLVAWLQELLYLTESEALSFDSFQIEQLTSGHLRAKALGPPTAGPDKIIKAVTYHNLHIRQTAEGYETTIVFDV